MGLLDVVIHLLNFAAPALVVAAALPLLVRLMRIGFSPTPGFGLQFGVNAAVGLVVLLAALWFWGRDGKMAAYLALCVACGSSQFLLSRGWKSGGGPAKPFSPARTGRRGR